MSFWNPDHPEADVPQLRADAWQQAAELATVDPQAAAALLTRYEAAQTAEDACSRALMIESARAEAKSALHVIAEEHFPAPFLVAGP